MGKAENGLRLLENIGFNAGTKAINFIFQVLANIILSRNLVASDFGIVGVAMVAMNFLNLFNDFGIGQAVIQKKDLAERELFTAFTIKTFIGILIFLVALIVAPFGAFLLGKTSDHQAVTDVLRLLGLNFVINSLSFVPSTLLSRDLNYKKISFAFMISSTLNSLVSILLVLAGLKYWSIVLANLVSTASLALVLNIFEPVRLKLCMNQRTIRELGRYSGYLFVSGIVIFVVMNADNFIIGAVRGSEALGYYSVAFYWGSLITVALSGVLHPALFPTFSRIQNEYAQIKTLYLKIIEYVGFFSVLSYAILWVVSKQLLVDILGHGTDKWLPSLVTLKILCLYGIFRSLLEPVGALLLAVGKTGLIFRSNCFSAFFEALLIFPALRFFGIEGVAVLVTIGYSLQYFVYFPFLKKEFGIHFADIANAVKPSIVAFALIAVILIIFNFPQPENQSLYMMERAMLGIGGYILIYGFVTNWKMVKEAKTFLGVKFSPVRDVE